MGKTKHDVFKEICSLVGIADDDIPGKWLLRGNQIAADGLNNVLLRLAILTGLTPASFSQDKTHRFHLIMKSREAMLQALQTINSPTLGYRVENFLLLFINAWESLLKAKLHLDGGEIFENDEKNKSKSISKCLSIIFPKDTDPCRKNVEDVNELRNVVQHSYVRDIFTPIMAMLFQQGVINFYDYLIRWFGSEYKDTKVDNMIFLIGSLDQTRNILISSKLDQNIVASIKSWEETCRQHVRSFSEEEFCRYMSGIDLKLAIEKKMTKADLIVRIDQQASDSALLVPFETNRERYKLTATDLVKEIQKIQPLLRRKAIYDIIKKNKIKENISYARPNIKQKEMEQLRNDKKHKKPWTYEYTNATIQYIIGLSASGEGS
jgi:hypothetical protein